VTKLHSTTYFQVDLPLTGRHFKPAMPVIYFFLISGPSMAPPNTFKYKVMQKLLKMMRRLVKYIPMYMTGKEYGVSTWY